MTEPSTPAANQIDKGKLPLVEATPVSLGELTPTDINKTIEVRVYRKWIAKNVKTQDASNFCAILLDKQGNAIQANMNFSFPEHHFNFIAYNEVADRANVSGAPLTDYIGCVYRISNPIISGEATRSKRTRRIIDIQNLDGVNLPFLIWGDMADKFDMDEYEKLQKPVIIAVSSAWANKRYERKLTTSLACKYKDLINPTPALEIQREPCTNQLDEQMRNRHTIESLLNVNPQHYQARPWYPNFTLDAVLNSTGPTLLTLPSTETTASPTAVVLDLPTSSNTITSDTKKDNIKEQIDNPEGKKTPVKRGLLQEAETNAKKPRHDK
ncbi:DNA helicase [Tanacetum coccineum]